MRVDEAIEALTAEEAQKLIDMDAVQKVAVERVAAVGHRVHRRDRQGGRAAVRGRRAGPDVSREGVQRDLLPIVEGSTVMTKYGPVKTDHILFIASGAFHVSKPSDLIPEMQGRFPIRVELDNLTEERLLQDPDDPEERPPQAVPGAPRLRRRRRSSSTTRPSREIARIAAQVNEEVENIGARRLHTILTTLLEEILFEVPEAQQDDTITVDEAYVRDRLSSVVENRDLSQYIL